MSLDAVSFRADQLPVGPMATVLAVVGVVEWWGGEEVVMTFDT